MDKVISFGKGIRRQPSIGDAGELSELVNLVPKNGELVNVKPMVEATNVPNLEDGEKLLVIHEVASGDNYIASKGSALAVYMNREGEWERTALSGVSVEDNMNVITIGNTIVVLKSYGVFYYLFKDGEYIYLGNKVPEMNISFGLQTKIARSKEFEVAPSGGFYVSVEDGKVYGNPSYLSDDKDYITEAILSQVNKFINEESVQKGGFIYPFFVRYAYRMYDDSLTMHSSPILMVCSTKCAPKVDIKRFHDLSNGVSQKSPKADFQVVGAISKLDFFPTANFEELEKWKDIIKSVDVFISQPLYTYDSSGKIGRINIRTEIEQENFVIGKHINRFITSQGSEAYQDYPKTYQKSSIDILNAMSFSKDFSMNEWSIELPSRTEDEIKKDIKDCSFFYLFDSFSIEKLSKIKDRTVIEAKEDVLTTLPTREVMSDDYRTHDILIANAAYVYNSRLNLSGVKRQLFDGMPSDSIFAHTDGYILYNNDSPKKYTIEQDVSYYVYIKEGDRDIVVGGSPTQGKSGTIDEKCNPLVYFYYPNPNAYKLVVRTKDYISSDGTIIYPPTEMSYEVPLEPHNFLSGAFFFNGWKNDVVSYSNAKEYTTTIAPSLSEDKCVLLPNSIFVSEVNNPFYFKADSEMVVGSGEIVGVSTSAKALSQGQFGQFPLYAFCTDGIWALEVAQDGTFSFRQPISRDVCNNPDSITQIDGAVVFSTDQGLKMIQGSDVVLLSSNMEGHNIDESVYFKPKADGTKFFAGVNKDYSTFDNLVVQETRDFREILKDCRIAYDYPNALLRIFPKKDYNGKYYVYSFDTREFAKVVETDKTEISSVVAGYPTTLVQRGNKILTFKNVVDDEAREGLLLTRPIDMGEPFALKKLHEMRTHYTKYDKDTYVKVVIFVSNDGVHWTVLPGLRRGSFKYYRLAMVTKMTDADRLSGTVMRYTVERNNKLR